MRDAELFSLTMGCVQHAKYSQCHRAPNCSAAWGAHYDTIPCSSDLHCAAFGAPRGCALKDSSTVFPEKREIPARVVQAGTCANHSARCGEAGGERVCVVPDGNEPGPLCGWF